MEAHIEERLSLLESNVAEVRDEIHKLRQLSSLDVAAALNKARFVVEMVLQRLCVAHDVGWGKGEPTLENMIGPLVARGVVPRNVAIHVRTVQTNASPGSHFQSDPLSASHLVIATMALVDFLHWHYGAKGLLPSTGSAPARPISGLRPNRPGDRYVQQAVEEYDSFYREKAQSSLRSALRVDPTHPLAHAYRVLFEGASGSDVDASIAPLRSVAQLLPLDARLERALAETALRVATLSPEAGRDTPSLVALTDLPEARFWRAELCYRTAHYADAELLFRQLLDDGAPKFRGRAYDHYSAVLLLHHKTDMALEVARDYAEAFPGEPDAVGVLATCLALSGDLDDGFLRANEALDLRTDDDTYAGLAKILALRGELTEAADAYREALARRDVSRVAIRWASLAFIEHLADRSEQAEAALEQALSAEPSHPAALFVGALIHPERAREHAASLRRLGATRSKQNPGSPRTGLLANLCEAVAIAGAGCVLSPDASASPEEARRARGLLSECTELTTMYHVPYASAIPWLTLAACHRLEGELERAREVLSEARAAYPMNALLLLESAAIADSGGAREALDRFAACWSRSPASTLPMRTAERLRTR